MNKSFNKLLSDNARVATPRYRLKKQLPDIETTQTLSALKQCILDMAIDEVDTVPTTSESSDTHQSIPELRRRHSEISTRVYMPKISSAPTLPTVKEEPIRRVPKVPPKVPPIQIKKKTSFLRKGEGSKRKV
jgi:hypothetical protein